MDDSTLYAHSRSRVSGLRHGLVDHLRGSAALARRFGAVFGAADLAEYLALVHDVGKGCCAWQDALINRAERHDKPVGVPHKEAGTSLAKEHTGRLFATVVQGHHGGLPDRAKVDEAARVRDGDDRDAENARAAVLAVARLIPEIIPARPLPPPAWLRGLPPAGRALGKDLLVRMLFSCLVDADFLDTSAHFDGAATPRVAADADMVRLGSRFEERRAKFFGGREPSQVGAVREDVYRQSVARAAGRPGVYVLHVPTGGGKTLASAGFALRHAAQHGLRRIIFAVPFISITEQNAQVYREMLDPAGTGDPVVLEHHSSADLDGSDGAGRWARLAAENWDAPVVVTTTVQLFQSLFANRPSAMRKLHRLAGAVIVLDEVQALPDRLLAPILSVLRGLVEHFGATVLLASATQPEFWSLPQLDGLPRHLVVEDVRGLFEELRRVRYSWRVGDDVSWESIAAEIADEPEQQVLTVVNTTKEASALHRRLADHIGAVTDATEPGPGACGPESVTAPAQVLHLSTRMTAEHRRETIEAIRHRLAAGLPTFVVSTSLIEAGVDIDFPCVYRAMAPAESLQQAAGRCNRNGRRAYGRVVVFETADGATPRDISYRAAKGAAGRFFGPHGADPDDLGALSEYYAERYAAQGSDGRAFGEEIQALRRELDFPEVAKSFQMIDDAFAQPVVVIRPGTPDEEHERITADLALLRSPYPCGPEVLRRLQPHTASLPRHEVRAAVSAGLAEPVIGDLVEWRGHYDPLRGLDSDQPEDRDAFVV